MLECPLHSCYTQTGHTHVLEVMPLLTVSHPYTPNEQLEKRAILAGIVVSSASSPNLITADMTKEGAAIIDVEINRIQDAITAKPKLVGDVDFEGVRMKAGNLYVSLQSLGVFVPLKW